MPVAMCEDGHRIYWRNCRGSKQPKICECGKSLKKAVYNPETEHYERDGALHPNEKVTSAKGD